MEIDNYLGTNNWFNYKKFYDFISEKKYQTLVEVGVWKGHSISYLAEKNRNSRIWAVDLFEETTDRYYQDDSLKNQIPHIYDIYQKNLENNKVREIITDIKGYSHESASLFENESIDFVFIDACHEYENVVQDIKEWFPKVKSGGIISGHDYDSFIGVKRAVDEFVGKYNLNLQRHEGYVWYCYKP